MKNTNVILAILWNIPSITPKTKKNKKTRKQKQQQTNKQRRSKAKYRTFTRQTPLTLAETEKRFCFSQSDSDVILYIIPIVHLSSLLPFQISFFPICYAHLIIYLQGKFTFKYWYWQIRFIFLFFAEHTTVELSFIYMHHSINIQFFSLIHNHIPKAKYTKRKNMYILKQISVSTHTHTHKPHGNEYNLHRLTSFIT